MPRTLLAPVSYGLGDLVVSLPAVQALIGEDQPVWLVARAPSQRLLAERVEGLAGVVDEADADAQQRATASSTSVTTPCSAITGGVRLLSRLSGAL